MRRVIVKEGSKGAAFVREMRKRKEVLQQKMRERMPPKEVMKMINEKTAETYELNKANGTFDKDSFRLGMMAMWVELKKSNQNLIPLEGKKEKI
jgi:hypothetical protein